MFSRFTASARRVMQRAFREAKHREHDFVGTEHLLFGALDDPDGPAVTLLRTLNAKPELLLSKVELSLSQHDGDMAMQQFPLSPASKRVFHAAVEEAAAFNHQMIGPEHLLLGILRERDCEAAQLLNRHGVALAALREAVAQIPPDAYHDAQIRADDRYTPSDNPSADELEAWIAPLITQETTTQEPGSLVPTFENTPPAVEAQLRRTQLFFGFVIAYCYGHWLFGWELGVALAFVGLSVAYINNLWISMAACTIIPILLFGSNRRVDDPHGLAVNTFTLFAGILVGSFLSDFWRFVRSKDS